MWLSMQSKQSFEQLACCIARVLLIITTTTQAGNYAYEVANRISRYWESTYTIVS